jgi:hypothetical protein
MIGGVFEVLGEAFAKTGWRLPAFVLMGNHYLLLLETLEGKLVTGLRSPCQHSPLEFIAARVKLVI